MKKGSTKIGTRKLIAELEKTSRERKEKLWVDIAKRLKKPRRNRAVVNLWKIDKMASKGDNKNKTFLIPGKVAAYGELKNKVNVAAFEFSVSAISKINENGHAMPISELIGKKVKAQNILVVK